MSSTCRSVRASRLASTGSGNAVDVGYDPRCCRHAAECLRGLPAVVRVVARLADGCPADPPGRADRRRGATTPTEVTALPGGLTRAASNRPDRRAYAPPAGACQRA